MKKTFGKISFFFLNIYWNVLLCIIGILLQCCISKEIVYFYSSVDSISILLAILGFIFTLRTFIVFELKRMMQERNELNKATMLIEQGLLTDYYSALKNLDQLFTNSLILLSINTLLSIVSKIVLSYTCNYDFIFIAVSNTVFVSSALICIVISIISSIIIGNIISSLHLPQSKL